MIGRRGCRRWLGCATGVLLTCAVAGAQKIRSFVNFESGHVRPLAFVDTPTTDLLLAVNTPDNRLAVYTATATGSALAAEVPVGLEPVAVAARQRTDGVVEAFVVNHLSDSVSVVTIDPAAPAGARLVRTLLVGDEPRDVVLAGPGDATASSSRPRTAGRIAGRSATEHAEASGRADVWVLRRASLGAPLGGTPLAIVQLPGDTPRALAASADGSRVYAAVFLSGNRTATIPEGTVNAAGDCRHRRPGRPRSIRSPSGRRARRSSCAQEPRPAPGRTSCGATGAASSRSTLPDEDVFVLDALASPPKRAAAPNAVAGVGTVIFNLAVRPGTGAVYATNLDARNHVRFEPVAAGTHRRVRRDVVHGTTPTPST